MQSSNRESAEEQRTSACGTAAAVRVGRDHNMNKSQTRGYGLATKTGSRREARRQNEGPGGTTGDSARTGQVESGVTVEGRKHEQVCCGRASRLGWGGESVCSETGSLQPHDVCVTGMSHKYQQRIVSTFYHIV